MVCSKDVGALGIAVLLQGMQHGGYHAHATGQKHETSRLRLAERQTHVLTDFALFYHRELFIGQLVGPPS